jgi:hypothetical protein
MPRTLNPTLATFIGTQENGANNRNFRISHRGDIVPNSIPISNPIFPGLAYQHFTPSYLITTGNVQTPAANNLNLILNDQDVPLNFEQTLLNFFNPVNVADLIAAHRQYINNISACTADIVIPPPSVAAYLAEMGFPNSPAGIPTR